MKIEPRDKFLSPFDLPGVPWIWIHTSAKNKTQSKNPKETPRCLPQAGSDSEYWKNEGTCSASALSKQPSVTQALSSRDSLRRCKNGRAASLDTFPPTASPKQVDTMYSTLVPPKIAVQCETAFISKCWRKDEEALPQPQSNLLLLTWKEQSRRLLYSNQVFSSIWCLW